MKDKNKINKTFASNNFYTSCFLISKGIRLVDIDKTNPRRAEFIFEDDGGINNLIRDFNFAEKDSPSVAVDARELVLAIKTLKEKIYQ